MKDEFNAIALKGTVTRMFYSDVGFSAGVVTLPCGETHRFAGKFCVQVDDMVVFCGKFENTQYGKQLKVSQFKLDIPIDPEGLFRFLCDNPRFKGIGKERARRIVDLCGDNFNQIITQTPEKLLSVKGITEAIVSDLTKEWDRRHDFNAAITALAALGLTTNQIEKVIDALGSSAVSVIETDPFQLIGIIKGFGFKRVDNIALKVGIPKESTSRIRYGIHHILNEQLSDGNTWMESYELLRAADDLLMIDCLESEDLIEWELDELTNSGELTSYMLENHELIALPQIFEMESYIREIFAGELI